MTSVNIPQWSLSVLTKINYIYNILIKNSHSITELRQNQWEGQRSALYTGLLQQSQHGNMNNEHNWGYMNIVY